MTPRRWVAISCLALAISLVPQSARAQLAPTGGHYAGRPSDTGFAGEVNSSGGYQASVPLDLPPARGGLPVPLSINYRERGVGAAGLGFDIPLSYIQRDTTVVRRRPLGAPNVAPQGREQVTLVLDGRALRLVRTASGWAAQRDAPDLAIREIITSSDDTWVVYDGQGRTYLFTVADPALAGAGLWHLASITGAGGNKVALSYAVGHPSVPGAPDAVSIDLTSIQYNPDTTGCFKSSVTLGYDAPGPALLVSPLGPTPFTRVHKLTSVNVASKATCGGSPQTLRSYQLQYTADADTALPRLTNVQMTGRQGTTEASTPVLIATYAYGSASSGGQLTYQASPVTIPMPQGTLQDQLERTVTGSPLLLGDVGYSTDSLFTDVTGDGRPDLTSSPYGTWPSTPTGQGGAPSFVGPSASTFRVPTIPPMPPPKTPDATTASTTRTTRYDVDRGSIEDGMTWRQVIDVDGDGRVDIIDAAEQAGAWVTYLNTPDPVNPRNTVWVRRVVSTSAIAQQLQSRGLLSTAAFFLPLSLRSSVRDLVYDVCAKWNGTQWWEYEDDFGGGNCPPGATLDHRGPETTIVQWELKDINGDGYPDVVFNSSSLYIDSQLASLPRPLHPFTGTVYTTRTDFVRTTAGNQIVAMLNVAGVHLSATSAGAFSAPIVLRNDADCGLSRWVPLDASHQQLACDLVDVNGDGVVDRVFGTSVFLGTGKLDTGNFFTAAATSTLPSALAIQRNAAETTCAPPANSATLSPTYQTAGLRDLTGDGIPDYISIDDASHWSVAVGTGTGFLAPIPVTGTPGNSFMTYENETCDGYASNTTQGLYDLDGDGSADIVSLGPQGIGWFRLLGSSGLPGAASAGRLVQVNNGYGAVTQVAYRSAKDDASTAHQVPFPEIVVDSVQTTGTQGLGGSLAATRYAYGGADLIFDPVADAFIFPGYRRSVELRIPSGEAQGVAVVTDTYGLATRSDPYGVIASPETTAAQRYVTYLRTGRPSDITVVSGDLGADPISLLSINTTNDARRIAATHYEWAAKLLASASDPAGPETCWEMVFPYDWDSSIKHSIYPFDTSDLCAAHGFGLASSTQSWRGAPGAAPPSTANVATRSEVQRIDDFGRVLRVKQSNDLNRTDEDICVDTTYAAPNGPDERVLSAPVSRTVSDCGSTSSSTLAVDRWEYDKLDAGNVSTGFLTSHTVERRSDTGQLLNTIREFDASYDTMGNPLTITSVREDGLSRSATLTYDPFTLAPSAISVMALGVPMTQITVVRDPVTLDVLSTTDANGTRSGTTYDGFQRPVISTVTPPGGSTGALSVTSYVGFTMAEPAVRSVVQKVFTDPVIPADVTTTNSAIGRISRVYLDELGREMGSEVALGTNYGAQKLIVGRRTYDSLGRAAVEAEPFSSTDPFPWTQSFAAAYGTTRYFNADGTPSCAIRGTGVQPFTRATDELNQVYPTCVQRSFQNNLEVVEVRDAASLLVKSPQDGVRKSSVLTASGRIIERSTWQDTKDGAKRLERAHAA